MATQAGINPPRLSEVMTRGVETIRPSATVEEAAETMKRLDVGVIPVCDGNRLDGILTDRDIVVRVIADRRDPKTVRVHDAMSPGAVYCYEDQTVEDAARLMEQKQIRRLPVLNRNNELVGIVSLGDLAVKTGETAIKAEALEKISEPAKPERKAG
ncbi:CBS domain-containing protein [Candidatus Nitrospira bockiana]